MNLECREMDLIQTPTHITYLCYYSNLKRSDASDWETIRDKYLLWCAANTNQTQDWDWYNAHAKKLKSFKRLNFRVV